MSRNYASGEAPMVGDLVDLGYGNGPRGNVLVVVGGPNAGSVPNQRVSDWESLGPGILVQSELMGGLVYEDSPDDETILISRHA
jgi:hypothetical protein